MELLKVELSISQILRYYDIKHAVTINTDLNKISIRRFDTLGHSGKNVQYLCVHVYLVYPFIALISSQCNLQLKAYNATTIKQSGDFVAMLQYNTSVSLACITNVIVLQCLCIT